MNVLLSSTSRCIAASAMFLGACASAPDTRMPPAPVPSNWGAPGITVEAEKGPVDWRLFFHDPALRALIAQAVESNRDLQIAAARVQEARAMYGLARADQFPGLSLSASGNVSGIPSSLTTPGFTSERWDLSLSSMAFELDFWGRLGSVSESARRTMLSTEAAQRQVYLSLIADIASTYFSKLQLAEQRDSLKDVFLSRQTALALIEQAQSAGVTYALEYQAARSQMESARASIEAVTHQLTQADNRLLFLVGKEVADLPEGKSLDEQTLELGAVGIPSAVLVRRPDVMAAEQRLVAARASLLAARAAFLPRVILTAGLGVAGPGLASLFSGSAWNFQPTLLLPLFDGGRSSSGESLAEARKVLAVADYEKTIQLAFREVSDLLSAQRSLERQHASAKAHLDAQIVKAEIAKARHHIGVEGYLPVLETLTDVNFARQTVSQLKRARLEAVTQLYRAIGGG